MAGLPEKREGFCVYHHIQTLAYHVDPAKLAHLTFYRLQVPRRWRKAASELARRRRGGEPASAPVVSLNRVVQYLLPDWLVAAHRHAWKVEQDVYWLTALAPVQPELLTRIVAAWLRQAFPGEGEVLAASLDPGELVWEGPVSPRWGCDARFLDEHGYWYNLLPYVVTTHLARADHLSWGGQSLQLRRVADEKQSGEMISWPPLVHGGYPWSLLVQFKLTTFVDTGARLHLHVGVRLWEKALKRSRTGAFDLKTGRRALYLARHDTWLDGKLQVPVFVPVMIGHSWSQDPAGWQGTTEWADSLMASVLSDLSLSPLPAVGEVLADLPRARERGVAGFVAALVRQPQENGGRGVRPGVSAQDRAQLFRSISAALPFLVPVEPTPRNSLGNASGRNQLGRWKDLTAEQRRDAVVQSLGGPPTVRVFHQTDEMKQAVTAALHHEFGGAVTVEAVPLGALGRPLDLDGRLSREAVWAAVKRRADEVARAVQGGAHGAIVELGWNRQGGSTSPDDPKGAIRLGLAKAGLVSQFLQPPDDTEVVNAENHRVTGAVRDLMRQLGIMLDWPRPGLQGKAFQETSLVALVTIRRHSNRRGRRQYVKTYIPVLVWMSTADTRLLVHYPGATEWTQYREAATRLAVADETDWRQNQAALHHWLQNRLLRDVLPQGRTLLMVDGYRTRDWWPWLANKYVTLDELKFGGKDRMCDPVPDPLWANLRIVRILPGDSEETAQWFAPGREKAGTSQGLFHLSARTFLSAQVLPSSTKNFLKPGHSKLDKPGKQGWLPRLMEVAVLLNGPDEDPAQWAAVAHHLRLMASHHREALMLPLPLHLAAALEEYVMPVPDEELEE